MGTTQGNSLCKYLYLKLAILPVSHFIFSVYGFSCTKSETEGKNRFCGEGGCEGCGGVGTSGRGEVAGKGEQDKHDANSVYTCM
jgi:hypothetical protein